MALKDAAESDIPRRTVRVDQKHSMPENGELNAHQSEISFQTELKFPHAEIGFDQKSSTHHFAVRK